MTLRSSYGRLIPAVALPLLWLTALRLFTFRGAENSMDAFYHVALADFGWNYFTATVMPHMSLSVWADSFSDKELLFHAIICGLRNLGRWLSLPSFPFHPYSLFFCLLIVLSFVYTAGRFRVRHLWFFALLLVIAVPQFTARILMLRPHDLALALMLLSCAVFADLRRWTDYWKPVALGMVFAWSYSNPHFVLLPAIAFAVPKLKKSLPAAAMLPLACILGIILGYIIHPQFPFTFINWKIQCFDVPLQMLSGKNEIIVGDELLSGGIRSYFTSVGMMIVVVFNVACVGGVVLKYGWNRLTPSMQAMTLAAFISFAGMGLSIRALEYACPFNILLAGMLFSRRHYLALPGSWSKVKIKTRRIIVAGCAAAILIIPAIDGYFRFSAESAAYLRPMSEYVAWRDKVNLPPGVRIANVIWSDYPLLLYSAPQQRYLWGMEPMFGYAANPEVAVKIEKFRSGQLRLTPEQLRELTGTPLVFVSSRGWQLAGDMAKSGYRIIYQGADGWLFNLSDSRQAPNAKTGP